MNKSCFKDCFYSFCHEHTRGYIFLFILSRPSSSLIPVPPPILPLVSVEHCLSFRLSFVISSLTFFRFFLWFRFVSFPRPTHFLTSLSLHSFPCLFISFCFLISSSFQFFYQSVAHWHTHANRFAATGRQPVPGGNLPAFACAVARPAFPSTTTNTDTEHDLSGSVFVWRRKKWKVGSRGGTVGRFFKYDNIKKQKRLKTLIY